MESSCLMSIPDQQHTSGSPAGDKDMWGETLTLGRRVATVGKHGKMPFKALGNIVVDAAPPDPARPCGEDGSKAVSRGTGISV
ncbi:hypothetical protein E2C01_029561 [Portunus trituberculatus]|uniref:Uncharacterized protein n=1 Tax=Portunus trituberculatus TaxID=210409 RepID=A0A5B7ET93_PORTR|nr:hypothetical protein [Portunus trituberculatus]